MICINSPQYRQVRRSRTSYYWDINIRTITSVTIALSVFALFSSESIYHDVVQRSLEMSTDKTVGDRFVSSHHFTSAQRNGFVQRTALRTNVLHYTDPLTGNHIPSTVRSNNIETLHPRIIVLDMQGYYSSAYLGRKSSNKTMTPREERAAKQVEPMSSELCCAKSPDVYILDFEQSFLRDCEPIKEPSVHPTCNTLHELELESDISLLSMKGSWRSVWTVDKSKIILKMLHMRRDFNSNSLESNALDAIVMDRLTASPHVTDAYGFCGQSVLTEFAPTGGRDYIKQNELRSRERLKIARDLARGLADLQSLRHLSNYDNKHHPVPVFAHNDINVANTVQVNGKVKWNDFNVGVLLRRQRKNATESCGSPVKFEGDLWRSPEEIRNVSYVRLEQSDVYSFGNILYQVMTRHQPWTHKEPEGQLTEREVAERKLQNKLPTIPEQYFNTTKTELQTLLLATLSCYHPIPERRPTAHELAYVLGEVYDRLKKKKKISLPEIRDMLRK